jgi:hypothetical protein
MPISIKSVFRTGAVPATSRGVLRRSIPKQDVHGIQGSI